MFLRLLKSSLLRRPKAMVLTLVSIVLGASVATAFLGLSGELSHKMALELRKYGANILVEPTAAGLAGTGYLREDDLPKIKSVFWKYNITGFAPFLHGIAEFGAPGGTGRGVVTGTWFAKRLEIPGEMPTTQGVRAIAPWWQVTGRYPQSPDEAVIGAALARRLKTGVGGEVTATRQGKTARFRVVGVVTTGGYEEEQLFAPLASVQELLAAPGKVSRVLVSALTVPMDDFGRRDPATMSRRDYEKWYCTAYVTSVAKNVEEAMLGSRATPVWQIAGAEGTLLRRLGATMVLLTMLALGGAAVAVSSALTAAMAERRSEIALMKAMGADRRQVALLFLGETALLGTVGGFAGFFAGGALASFVSRQVFAAGVVSPAWLFPVALSSALLVALSGAAGPLRQALRVEPAQGLKG
ncbi:ABC transporter permease [Geobacter pickeringii]|uniref:ABC transporter permease n=1 Tax=Geobacter pickeringii TaxID=345632 RepID=A0A0B5BKR2_9BACT|nr:ABC transporter permease [Geobacter pickeringii]AJE04656.1 hypothetical protein GPICK_15910 [Geobacter pickeringii]